MAAKAAKQHNRVHVKVQRRDQEGSDWTGKLAVRFDLVDRHGSDVHLYVRPDSYLGKVVKIGDQLEIMRK